ncbi:hypothetical protein C0993_011242 [Termitomyces sp. T159_Od127]|nr:hypothetical protein C0993_011242 [Termitomyces sp. T159_Od127]
MAKKSLNPADSYRKAQRKKELKKNKAERSKARDLALVKKDTWDLEDEIQKLEEAKNPKEQDRLAELKAELEKINRKKAEKDGDAPPEEIILPKRKIFNKKGLPRHPERSIYYDPVMNPYGVAPPGMQYMERAPLPGEVWTDEESSDNDDDIMMPEGPPPPRKYDEDFDVDGIEMPEGPPPHHEDQGPPPPLPPLPPGPPPPSHLSIPSIGLLPPPPPPGFPSAGVGFPMVSPALSAYPSGNILPPPGVPLGFPPPGFPSNNYIPPPMPPPPPGFFPRKNQPSIQNTLPQGGWSTVLPHPSLPPKPTLAAHTPQPSKQSSGKTMAEFLSASVSAEPQLRDLKKEATAFVPAAVKRKKPGASVSSSRVNAAPGVEGDGAQEPAGPARPDLLSTLQTKFGSALPPPAPSTSTAKKVEKKKDDYDKFMEEMSGILGPTKENV